MNWYAQYTPNNRHENLKIKFSSWVSNKRIVYHLLAKFSYFKRGSFYHYSSKCFRMLSRSIATVWFAEIQIENLIIICSAWNSIFFSIIDHAGLLMALRINTVKLYKWEFYNMTKKRTVKTDILCIIII